MDTIAELLQSIIQPLPDTIREMWSENPLMLALLVLAIFGSFQFYRGSQSRTSLSIDKLEYSTNSSSTRSASMN